MSESPNGQLADGAINDHQGGRDLLFEDRFQAPSWNEMVTIIEVATDLVEAVHGFFEENIRWMTTELTTQTITGMTMESAVYLANLLHAAIKLRDMFGPIADVQRPQPVGWPPAVRVQLHILHNRVDQLWTGLELNRAPSEALDVYRKGSGLSAIQIRPDWTGHEVVYASVLKAALHLYNEVSHPAWRATAAAESVPQASRLDAMGAVFLTDHLKVMLTQRTAAALQLARLAHRRATEAPARPQGGSPRPLVILGEPGDEPRVKGKIKPRLTLTRYDIIKTLIDAAEKGLTGDELVNKSKHGGAINTLKTMARDSDWGAVIQLPGSPGGRYRIISRLDGD